MTKSDLFQIFANKDFDQEEVVNQIIKKPKLILDLIAGLNNGQAAIKYGCAKILRRISEQNPDLLYPQMDFFLDQLDSENNIFKWNATFIIANLSSVDRDGKFEKVFDKYFAPIPGPVLITAANTIGSAAKIALAKPELTDKISHEILKVENAKYQTDECRNIALGHAIKSFEQFFDQISAKKPVINLVKKQLRNSRNATKKKAEKFLKKYKINVN